MINYLYNWFVIKGVNEEVPYFWSTPVGSLSILILFVTSLIILFKEKPDIVSSIYHWLIAGVCVLAFLHIVENSNPRHQMMVIVLALAVKHLRDVFLLFRKGVKNGSRTS